MSVWRRQGTLSWMVGVGVSAGLVAVLLLLRHSQMPVGEVVRPPEPEGRPVAEAPRGAEPAVYLGVAVPRRSVDLSAPVRGEIVELMVHFGDRVEAGTPVARLDDAELVQQLKAAEAGLGATVARRQEAELQLRLAQARYARQVSLAASGIISAESLEEMRFAVELAEASSESAAAEVRRQRASVERARKTLKAALIVAPFTGTVTVRYRQAGESVGAGEPVLRLVSSEDLIVRFVVPVGDAPSVQAGTSVLVGAAGGRRVTAVVERLGAPVVASKLVIVEAALDADAGLSPDLPVDVSLRVDTSPLSRNLPGPPRSGERRSSTS